MRQKEIAMEKARHILILLFCCLTLPCSYGYTDETKADIWDKAEGKFIRHISPQLERLRRRLNNPHLNVMQIRDPLLKKYLPGFRLYVIDSNLAQSSRVFFVHQKGRVFDLGYGSWISTDSKGTQFALPKIADFLRLQKIQLRSSREATELVKMIELMLNAPDFVGQLRRKTKNFTVLDKNQLRDMFSETSIWTYTAEKNWKYLSEKSKKGWVVQIDYIGPPASVMARPKYSMEVQSDGRLTNISATF